MCLRDMRPPHDHDRPVMADLSFFPEGSLCRLSQRVVFPKARTGQSRAAEGGFRWGWIYK